MTIYTTITTTSLVIAALTRCTALVPSTISSPLSHQQHQQQQPAFSSRLAFMDKDDAVESLSSDTAISQTLTAHTSIQQFLTQRSVQTFMFLLKECHDPHTARWIEDFTEAEDLLSYHGTKAFNCERFPGWDSVLTEMMAQPPDVVVLDIEKNLFGLSKNNPFRKKQNVVRTIQIDIEPPSLAGRILSVRESLSREWTHDLERVISINDKIISDDTDTHLGQYHAFENASNFDVLFLLSTQESVHRVLKSLLAAGEPKATSYQWLLEYYSQNANQYFDGKQQRYGSSHRTTTTTVDGFLDNLATRTLPYIINKESGGVDQIDNPLSIVDEIVRVRGEVAREWRDMMSLVPESHSDIRKDVFMRQMSTWIQHFDQPIAVEVDAVEKTHYFQ